MASQVLYKTIKVYLAGIRLEHQERDLEDPTKDELLHLLCTGIKRSQGTRSHTCFPNTINVLKILKSQLCRDPSFPLLEKRLLRIAFTLAFYGFLRASELANAALIWQCIHLESDRYTVFIEQSKTDHFRCGHTITIYATGTSTCSVRALRLYMEASVPSQASSPVFKGGRFSPLDRQHLTIAIHNLLQNTHYNYQHYASYSFRSGAATTATAAGIPDWLIKFL